MQTPRTRAWMPEHPFECDSQKTRALTLTIGRWTCTLCTKLSDLTGGGGGHPGTTAPACAQTCKSDKKCAAYVFRKCGATATCWLKGGGWKQQKYKEPAGCALCSQVLKQMPIPGNGDVYWGPTNAMLSLIAYAEAERGAGGNASSSVYTNVSNT
eukprot:SAG11_NODE_8028_length_1068_cov_0.760578_2_plen_154_part_01